MNLVLAPAVRLMKRRVLSRLGVNRVARGSFPLRLILLCTYDVGDVKSERDQALTGILLGRY